MDNTNEYLRRSLLHEFNIASLNSETDTESLSTIHEYGSEHNPIDLTTDEVIELSNDFESEDELFGQSNDYPNNSMDIESESFPTFRERILQEIQEVEHNQRLLYEQQLQLYNKLQFYFN